MKIQIAKFANLFIANVGEVEFIVKVLSNGFETLTVRNGKPVPVEKVTCEERELLERVHEAIMTIMVNEVSNALEIGENELLELLENAIDETLQEVVVQVSSGVVH